MYPSQGHKIDLLQNLCLLMEMQDTLCQKNPPQHSSSCQACYNNGFGKRWFSLLPKTGDSDENGENDQFTFPYKNKGFGPGNDENGGFTESRVFTTPILGGLDFVKEFRLLLGENKQKNRLKSAKVG